MSSYRHVVHAGNHGDILKHVSLIAILKHLLLEHSPLLAVDTHAGAGQYDLTQEPVRVSGEARAGILKLLQASHLLRSQALQDYLQLLDAGNPQGLQAQALIYPGSPLILAQMLASPERLAVPDCLRLCEWHPAVLSQLQTWAQQQAAAAKIRVEARDGFAALQDFLPPMPAARRALVLLDPDYELSSDYQRLLASVAQGLERFAAGVYLLWYPVINQIEARDLPGQLKDLSRRAGRPWLHAVLHIGTIAAGGMAASGIFVINPPHALKEKLAAALPQLQQILGQGRRPDQHVLLETSTDAAKLVR